MLQVVHKNVQLGMHELLEAIPPAMHTVQAAHNPPFTANISSVSFLYLSATLQISYQKFRKKLLLSNMAKLGYQVPKLSEKADIQHNHMKTFFIKVI